MEFLPLTLQIVLGAFAAIIVARLVSRLDEGLVLNALAGLVGGIVISQVLGTIVGLLVAPDMAGTAYLATSVVGGIIGGTAAMFLAGSVGKGPLPH